VASTALVLHYTHPLNADKHLSAKARQVFSKVAWRQEWSPGQVTDAVFDPVDWYFVPIGAWGQVNSSGPHIRLGQLPLNLEGTVPTAQQFYTVLYRILLANQAAQNQDWDRAVLLYDSIAAMPFLLEELLSQNTDFNLHMGWGIALFNQEDLVGAIKHWHRANNLKPGQGHLHYYLGTAYLSLKQLDKAVQHLEIAIRLDINQADYCYNLGLAYLARGNNAEAISIWERALILAPTAKTGLQLASLYAQIGRPAQARRYAIQALNLGPTPQETNQLRRLIE
jgi:tetratricopeptide (TPR) repeat protein